MDALPLVHAKYLPGDTLLDEDGPGKITIGELLTFSHTSVPNLYTLDNRNHTFKFHYSEGDVMTRLSTSLPAESPGFSAFFTAESHLAGGISYLGRVEVTHSDGAIFTIRLPGERSFDPASTDQRNFVNRQSFRMIISVTVAGIQAAKAGAGRDFIDAMYRVLRSIVDQYYGKALLQEWMKHQVLCACYEKCEPKLYPQYLRTTLLGAMNTERIAKNLQELVTTRGSPPSLLQGLLSEKQYRKEMKTELGPRYGELKTLLRRTGLGAALGRKILHEPQPLVEEPERSLSKLRVRATALETLYVKRFCQLFNTESLDMDKSLKGQCAVF